MVVQLDKIGAEPVRWQETANVSAASLERVDLLDLGEISWSGKIWIEDPGFRLQASLAYEQTVACGRCLEPIVEPVETSLRLVVLVNPPEPMEAELELESKDFDLLSLGEEVLDTDSILREQLQLNVPMRAVCREDCQGLCPVCGVNRNHDDCDCREHSVDPRWEVLRGLKK